MDKTKRRWILDADIKGAFDNIRHEYLLNAIGEIPGKELIKQWLKAGYVEAEIFHDPESGTPQGGIISPLLANGNGKTPKAIQKEEGVQISRLKREKKNREGTQTKIWVCSLDDFIITAIVRIWKPLNPW